MPACPSTRRLGRVTLLAGAAAALTLMVTPALADDADDPNADVQIDSTYTVEQGDHLSAIADEHDLDDWVVVYAVNADEIDEPDLLMIGQELDLPADPDEVDVDAVDIPSATSLPAPEADDDTSEDATGDAGGETASTDQPAPEPQPEPQPSASVSGSVWDRLAQCESGGNWSINTGNGFYGGLQFHPQTWAGHGGHEYAPNAHLASREQEIAIAERVLASQGWGAWPSCSSQLGLR